VTEDKNDGLDPTGNPPDTDASQSVEDDHTTDVSLESASLTLEKETALEEAPAILNMKPEPDPGPGRGESAKPEPVRDRFKPFYKKEAHLTSLKVMGLYFLLGVFGLGLLGFGVQVFLDGAPFRLEVATIVIIIFALLGFLWKTVSLEAKTGLAAAGVGLVLAVVFTVYGGSLGLPYVPGELILAMVYCLSLAALLVAAWLYWPRLFWPPIAITVLVVYAALDPVLWLVAGAVGPAEALVSGPDLMRNWPIYVRPGFLMAQVVLPAGAILLLVMQGRTILKPQFASHWGYAFWALLLFLASTTGLAVLERADYSAYPNFPALVAKAYPRALPPAPATVTPVVTPTDDKQETVPTTAAAPDTAQDQTATGAGPATDQAAPESQTTTTPAPDAAAPPDEAAGTAAGSTPGLTDEQPPATAETAPPDETGLAAESAPPVAATSEDLNALKAEVNDLKKQVTALQDRLQAQEMLIHSLLNYFGSDSEQSGPPWPTLPDTMPLPLPDGPDLPGETDPAPDSAPSST
jgi:hypothetical protein